jgi:cobalt-zinc-cadmium efflux system membrane fusion protein
MACACALIALSGCNTKSQSGEAQASERQRDYIKIEPGSPRLDFVKVEPVAESNGAGAVALTGRVTFDEDHTQRVASPVDGRVQTLLARPGDKVRAGQALLELSSPQVGQIQADAQKAQLDFSVASKGLDRVRKLQADGAVSDKEFAQAEADFKKARADVARAEAQLKALGISATDPAVHVSLHAQIGGTVVERNVLQGQEVRADAAQPLLTISSLDLVWVLADVYEQDLGLVKMGAAVSVRVPAYPGESFAGKVVHVGDVVDPTTRTVKVRCAVPNLGGRLKPEMFAKIELAETGGQHVIAIPARAVLADGERSKVIVASEDHVFRVRQIEVGPEVSGNVRVLSGLRPGERIVTDGALFLKHEIEEL